MLASRWRSSLGLFLAAMVAWPEGRADETATAKAAAKAAAERDAQALGWLIQRGVRALAQPAEPANQPQIDDQRRQQINQHAKQMERQFQPILNGELELIRRTCGGLAPDARQRILAAGREAVTATARGFTERQFTGQLGQDDFDPRREIRSKLEQALAAVADPAAPAAYREEIDRRQARLGESARVAIVANIDRQLQLSAGQRSQIEKELERKWQAAWARDLGFLGDMRINGLPPAPDYAAEAIEPHLDRDQAVTWKKWLRQASSRNFARHFGWNFDGQGLQQLDPWWGR
jgi:hypothetical protein